MTIIQSSSRGLFYPTSRVAEIPVLVAAICAADGGSRVLRSGVPQEFVRRAMSLVRGWVPQPKGGSALSLQNIKEQDAASSRATTLQVPILSPNQNDFESVGDRSALRQDRRGVPGLGSVRTGLPLSSTAPFLSSGGSGDRPEDDDWSDLGGIGASARTHQSDAPPIQFVGPGQCDVDSSDEGRRDRLVVRKNTTGELTARTDQGSTSDGLDPRCHESGFSGAFEGGRSSASRTSSSRKSFSKKIDYQMFVKGVAELVLAGTGFWHALYKK